MYGAPILEPLAGFTNASSSGSATAMDTPPIPAFREGKMENWSACATGTVLMPMSWADAVPAPASNSAVQPTICLIIPNLPRRDRLRLTLLRHGANLPRLVDRGVHDLAHKQDAAGEALADREEE